MKKLAFTCLLISQLYFVQGQIVNVDERDKNPTLTELVMSMSQRSLVMPGYLTELKALIALQAYNFWIADQSEPYVSHLNVYSSLHEANKFLGYDSIRMMAYNQVGFHSRKVTSILFGADADTYYSASADGKILKWSLSNPKAIPETVYSSNHIIRSLDLSDDGKLLLATHYQAGVSLISLDGSKEQDIRSYEDPEPVQSAVFIPGEQKYLSVTKSGDLKIKGIRSETLTVGKTNLKVNELKVDKNDGTIYAGSREGTLEAWEKPYEVKEDAIEGILEKWKDQSYFGYELGSFSINCLDISPDGRLLAIGRERGDVILWNMESKKLQRIISGHQSAITDLDFSPDGLLLLTTSRDKTARIWDLNDSKKLPVILDDHDDWVFTGSFDPSGTLIITGSGDDYLRTWPVDPGKLAERLCNLLSRNMTQEEWLEFVGTSIPFRSSCN